MANWPGRMTRGDREVAGGDHRRLKSGGEQVVVAGNDRRRGCVSKGGQVVVVGIADPMLYHYGVGGQLGLAFQCVNECDGVGQSDPAAELLAGEDRGQFVQEMPAEHGRDPARGQCLHDLGRYAVRVIRPDIHTFGSTTTRSGAVSAQPALRSADAARTAVISSAAIRAVSASSGAVAESMPTHAPILTERPKDGDQQREEYSRARTRIALRGGPREAQPSESTAWRAASTSCISAPSRRPYSPR